MVSVTYIIMSKTESHRTYIIGYFMFISCELLLVALMVSTYALVRNDFAGKGNVKKPDTL